MPRRAAAVQAEHEPTARPGRSTARRTLVTSELLDQATTLFSTQGYDATSLQDIADAMGISRPALYHYVKNKDELLGMLVDQVSQGLADDLGELATRGDLSATQKLRELTTLLVRQRAKHPAQFRILDQAETMLPEPASTKHVEAKRRVLREMIGIIESGTRSGEFIATDARTAAFSLLGMCNWVAWWAKPSSDVEAIAATITEFAERMLVRDARGGTAGPTDVLREIRRNLDWLEQQL